MAADQWKKRLSGATVTGDSSWEQHRAKRKNLGTQQNKRNFKSHISLKWDGSQKKVIAKRDQVGISWRHLRPYLDPIPEQPSYLADVISVPQEIFELENLTDVLSYEVWNTHLLENERNWLVQFLPGGSDTEQVVQALLNGDNLHFGNHFLGWSTSLCAGNLHPDAVITQERSLKADNKAYYSELEAYHNDMIEYLSKLKESWVSCKDAEKEIMQKKWRFRNEADKRIPSHVNDYSFRELDESAAATSESYSVDEKACSGDYQNSLVMKGAELQKGIYNRGVLKDKFKSPMTTSDVVLKLGSRPRGDKLLKRNIQCSDGAKYMSYVKISKKQHELVKNMKQCGKSFQSKSLNRVLGNIDTSQVQPYEAFVMEEQKKLHDHWLHLVRHDLPQVYENWKGRHLQVRQLMKSLDQELKTTVNFLKENLGNIHPEQKDMGTNNHSGLEDEDGSVPSSPQIQTPAVNRNSDTDSSQGQPMENCQDCTLESHQNQPEEKEEEEEKEQGRGGEEEEEEEQQEEEEEEEGGSKCLRNHCVEDEKSLPICTQEYNGAHFSPVKDSHKMMDAESTEAFTKSDDNPNVLMYSENLNTGGFAVGQELPLSSGEDVWPAVSMPQSYYDAASHEYASSSAGLPPVHPKVGGEPQAHLMDLQSNLHKEDTTKDILRAQPDDGSFSSFPNQDRNELLQSFYKDAGTIPYLKEHRQTRMGFQPQNNVLLDERQFPGHFQQLPQMSLPTEQHQKRQNETYMQRNLSENIYSQGHGYLTSGHEHLRPVNLPHWDVGPVPMSTPLQSHLNGDFSNQSWFSNETRIRSGWTGPDGTCLPNQSIGSGNNMDQSLFSVLSHCNQIRTGSFYDPASSAQQLVSSRNYGVGSGICPNMSTALPQVVHSLDYLGGRGAATSLMTDEIMWMPHQNPTSNDSMGKPFLKPWGQ